MLTEVGKVIAIEGESIWVETLRQSSCNSCSARAGCGHGLINTAMPGTSRGVVKALRSPELPSEPDLHDTVEISLPERRFLHAVGVLYLLPIVLAVVAAIASNQLLQPLNLSQGAIDFWTLLATLCGIGAGLFAARLLNTKVSNSASWQPLVTALVSVAGKEGLAPSAEAGALSA